MALVKLNSRGTNNVSGNRNLMINGAMQVSQRGTSTTGLKNTGGVFTLDRFSYRRGGTWTNFDAKHEQVDVTDALPLSVGLTKALKVTCTTAEGSVPSGAVNAGEAVGIGNYLEKSDTHTLGVGTSSMSVSTLSFYVKASIATTYGISIGAEQHATSQRLQIPFTVSQANVYERISITIPTYNVALNNSADSAQGWRIHWILDGIASGRTASQWNPHNDGTSEQVVILPNGVSTTGFSNTLNATFEITGVQLERGDVLSDFEHRPLSDELNRCYRYCYVWKAEQEYDSFCDANIWSTSGALGQYSLPMHMNHDPALEFSDINDFIFSANGQDKALTGMNLNRSTPRDVQFFAVDTDHGFSLGVGGFIRAANNTTASITLEAEL